MINDTDESEYTMRAIYEGVHRLLAWTEVGTNMSTTIRFVDFVDFGDGRTEVISHQTNVPAPYRTPEALAEFATSLDRFDAYVARLAASR